VADPSGVSVWGRSISCLFAGLVSRKIAGESNHPTVSGVEITEEGVTSSFTVTQDMLDDLNMERLEHITVRNPSVDSSKRLCRAKTETMPFGLVNSTSTSPRRSYMERLEHITVRVWIEHERRGDVEVELTSPNGIVSVLARQSDRALESSILPRDSHPCESN
jgi:hypothetical protein